MVQLISVDCLLQLVPFECLIACVSLCYVLVAYLPLAILVPQYSWSSSKYYRWICVLHSTLLLRNTQLMEEHNLYWPSKLFAHFRNRCQWGRSFREFCGEGFQSLLLALDLFLSICISYTCIIGCCTAW